MKILVISDSHGSYEKIKGELTESVDALVVLGDIDYYELRKMDQDFSCPKFGVLGNHDSVDYFEGTSIVSVHREIIEFGDKKIAGFGGCPRYNRRMFGQYHEEDVKLFTKSISEIDLFIAHSNPMLEPSWDESDPHRGFMAFTDMMKEADVAHFVHGHIHQQKEYMLNKTHVYSVYPYKMIII